MNSGNLCNVLHFWSTGIPVSGNEIFALVNYIKDKLFQGERKSYGFSCVF